ncbi:MAG: COG1470 family protein [Gammaproteobacteria bacterium]
MKSSYSLSFGLLTLVLASVWLAPPAWGASLGAGISPSRFELRAKPGQVLRDTVRVINASDDTSEFRFRTVDWRLNDSNGVDFLDDEMLENSCRPWIRLERQAVKIRAGAEKKYRFEVHVPEDAPAGLCRFAIMIEPDDKLMPSDDVSGQIKFPITGRYAVITYVTVGDAKADIDYLGLGETLISDQRLPTLKLRNQGTTYDRTFGEVVATDPTGQKIQLIASNFPVLPGRTEEISLAPRAPEPGQNPQMFQYPLRLKGKVEIGGETITIDEVFE